MINEIVKMPKPKKEYLNNSKVANYISTQNNLFSNTLQLTTMPRKNIFVTVDLSADENLALSSPNITQYDMAVMDLDPEIIPGDKLFMMQGATLYEL